MIVDLDALDNCFDKTEKPFAEPPYTNGSLSVVVSMDDMELILRQMWKSRQTEPKMGELYEKYNDLISFDNESHSQ